MPVGRQHVHHRDVAQGRDREVGELLGPLGR